MRASDKKTLRCIPLGNNDSEGAIDFDYGALDDSPVFSDEFGICLKDAVNNYLRRKIFIMFRIFDILTEEERQILLGREVYGKTFRQLGREINRDHKTVQSRYYDALFRIRNSPLVKVEFKHQLREN
jgi:DNA-directed RNA polymerase specialized sigma24 family protein